MRLCRRYSARPARVRVREGVKQDMAGRTQTRGAGVGQRQGRITLQCDGATGGNVSYTVQNITC